MFAPGDEVAVAVAVARRAHHDRFIRRHCRFQFINMRRGRIGVAAAKIGERLGVEQVFLRQAEAVGKHLHRIRAGGGVHRIKHKGMLGDMRANGREIKQRFHQIRIIGGAADDAQLGIADAVTARLVERRQFDIGNRVLRQGFRNGKGGFGGVLRRRLPGSEVELDAEIAVLAAWVVTGGQNNPKIGMIVTDDMRGSRRRKQAVFAEQHQLRALRHRHFQHNGDRFIAVIAAIATEDERLARHSAERGENRLDKTLGVVRLLIMWHRLAQPGSSRTLVGECGEFYRLDFHTNTSSVVSGFTVF